MARRTKIIATIGPASDSEGMIKDLAEAGMDVARIGLAHGTLDEAIEKFRRVRRVEASLGRPLGVMVDLPGPKVRAGTMPEGGLAVSQGEMIRLTPGADRRSPGFVRGVTAFAAGTTLYWAVRIPMILLADHPVGFKVVHAVLAAVSIALAVAAWRSVRSSRA